MPLEQVFRDEWGRVLASLIGFLGDFDLAEEAAQDAFAIAAARWPREGEPANPTAWLVTTARNRAIDRIRRDRTGAEKLRLLDVPKGTEDEMDETTIPDERLELLFTCCHPALALDAQVALTLRTLGGRGDLAAEAIRFGRALAELMPDEPEVHGLLALMLLNDARRKARFADGSVVLLRDQDRSLWDEAAMSEGLSLVGRARALGGRGPYLLQAEIAALHAAHEPDWPLLAERYRELALLTGSPVVELNRAAALAEAGDVEQALSLADGLELEQYHYLHATRAELLRRLDRTDDARTAYRRALELVSSDAERRFLEQRLAELDVV